MSMGGNGRIVHISLLNHLKYNCLLWPFPVGFNIFSNFQSRWRWNVEPYGDIYSLLFFVIWSKLHFRVMSSTSKITKGDKQMYLMWTVPITHLRHAFIQWCASNCMTRLFYLNNYYLVDVLRKVQLHNLSPMS
jgi:hypothetical protein